MFAHPLNHHEIINNGNDQQLYSITHSNMHKDFIKISQMHENSAKTGHSTLRCLVDIHPTRRFIAKPRKLGLTSCVA